MISDQPINLMGFPIALILMLVTALVCHLVWQHLITKWNNK